MALEIYDRVKETTTTTGTGTYTLAGAVTGFETFTANLDNSDTTYYCCTDNTDFEIGLGTFTSSGTTLARTTVLASSNSNSAVSWSSGTKTIFMTYPAGKAVFKDASGNVDFGVDDTGIDVKFYGATSGSYLLWDESADSLLLTDSTPIKIGDSQDLTLYHDGSNSYITNAVGALKIATETSGIAVTIGHTTSEVTIADNLTVTGTLTLGSGAELAEAELEMLDGITAGTVAASKAMVVDSNKDIGTVRNLTIDGTFSDGNYTFDTSGNVSGLGTVASGAITSSGIVTGTGFTAGSAVLAEAELELLDGLTAGTAIASKVVTTDANIDTTGQRNLTISGELDAATLDISGNADIDGTTNLDAVDIDGAVQIDATVTVGADDQGYDIIFYGDAASANMTWDTSADDLIFNGAAGLIIPDGQLTLGSTAVSSTAAELNLLDTASANSVVNSKAVIYGSSGELAGTLSTAAQANITSVGTLTALTVDEVAINGKIVTMTGSSGDTFTTTVGTNGATSLVTVDTAAAAAHLEITADGTVDINSAGVLTLDSGAAINIEPASGSAILLDGTISVDAGVVTGATSITSTAFVGNITGNVTGNASGTAATVTGAAQSSITSLGTLTTLSVDNITINGNDISSTAGTDLTITPLSGQQIVLDGTIVVDAGVVTGATSITSTAFVGDITGDVTGNADTVTVTDSTANTNFPVVFHNESNALLDDTGALRYNPSTGTLLVPNLSVAGTTTTVDTVTMQAANAVVFEGATADVHETTLSIVDPTGDHTQYLINQGGYIPVLAAVTTTAITSTPAELNILDGVTSTAAELNILDGVTATTAELNIMDGVTSTAAELNLLDGVSGLVQADLTKLAAIDSTAAEINLIDGGTARGTTSVASGDGLLVNDGGTMRMTNVDTVSTYFSSHNVGGSNIVTTGALNSGSITSGFGTIDTGSSTITTTGLISGGSLDIDDVLINGTTIGHTDDTDLMTVASGILTVAGEVSMTTLDIGGTNVTATAAELNILDGVTSTAAELNALDGITAVVGELNALDIGATAVGTAVASKAVILDSNKDYTGLRNFTVTGELDAATGDFSGDVDIDGTLEADAITVNGSTLASVIADEATALSIALG